jgi:probable O-glycosylation ligase (exosortase A-associated)
MRNIKTENEIMGVFVIIVIIHFVVILLNPQVLDLDTREFVKAGYFLGDGNDFALSVCITLPMAIYIYTNTHNKLLKYFFGISSIFLTLSIIATQSRGGTLGLAAIIIYYFLESKKKLKNVFYIGICTIILLMVGSTIFFERMASIKNYKTDSTAQQRINAWKAGIRMAIDNPLFGIGPGGFGSAYGRDYRPKEFQSRRGGLKWLNAHSIYFQLLGETGLPGFLLLLILIFGNLKKNKLIIRELKNSDEIKMKSLFIGINASIIGFATAGAFLTAAYYPHLYVLVAISTCAQMLYIDHKRGDNIRDNV